MIHDLEPQTRRAAMMTALAAAGAVAAISTGADAEPRTGGSGAAGPPLTGHEHDWDWLAGRWTVRHRRLKGRLIGSTEWEDFNGTSAMWPTLGGLGNVDDNVLEIPSGTYRAVSLRSFDPKTEQWSIWWLDGRDPTVIEPPVKGGFKDGIGTFVGDDVLNGRPIKVRFTWSAITPTSAHWEQAFSPDGGATWEVNWRMEFRRAG
jgi:hypothetical protein